MHKRLKILVTAGPTREKIDPVRFISNRSSGKMGYAIAEAAVNAGHEVVLISGPVCQPPPDNVLFVSVETAGEMYKAVMQYVHDCDVVIMAAAVADYRPVKVSTEKIKKTGDSLVLKLERTKDILAELGEIKKTQNSSLMLIGFAAETSNIEANAYEKLKSKNLDWIIANDVSKKDRGFEADTNEVFMFSAKGKKLNLLLDSKKRLAKQIIQNIFLTD